ncbi:hypothetical protein B0O80DRAFT_527425 [Mortierella sp. GBAus27b]|nr:hypothetical protein B0O80DRAFT_527425 [Mortierella sp. GBAus27b]
MLKSFKQYNSTLHVDGDMTDQKAHSHSKRNGEGENPSHEAQLGLIRTQLLTQHPAIQLPEQPVPSNIIGDNHPSIPSRNQVRRVVRSAKRAQGLCKKPRTRDQSTKNNLDGRSAIVPERRISLHHPKKGQSQQWSQTRTSYSTLDTSWQEKAIGCTPNALRKKPIRFANIIQALPLQLESEDATTEIKEAAQDGDHFGPIYKEVSTNPDAYPGGEAK